MGFGISGGTGFIWVCIPYLNNAGTKNVTQWWGDMPKYNPQPTLEYCKKVVPWVCKNYGGDLKSVVLCGFSRGAIACNYLGLYDDDIALFLIHIVRCRRHLTTRTPWSPFQ